MTKENHRTVDEDKSDDAVVFELGNMIAAVSLMTYPIPNGFYLIRTGRKDKLSDSNSF